MCRLLFPGVGSIFEEGMVGGGGNTISPGVLPNLGPTHCRVPHPGSAGLLPPGETQS